MLDRARLTIEDLSTVKELKKVIRPIFKA
jgi:hypothetical protein